MKTRARWRGLLPDVGDFLRTSRTLYVITAVGKPTEARPRYVGAEPSDGDERRVTLTIERVDERAPSLCLSPRVHPFRWDPRGKRRRSPLVFNVKP